MTIRDLAVHVDHGAHSQGALTLTLDLAEHFGARVSAIYVDPIPLSPQLLAMSTAPQLVESLFEEQELRALRSKSMVEEAATKRAIAWEWRQAEGPLLESLAVQARTADLLVTTQEGDGDSGPMFGGFAEHAVMGSGRPVLVVPFIGAKVPLGGRAVVAWDGGAQSARAASDAIPLLTHASDVEVVTIRPQTTELGDAPLPGAEMCEHLARHGIDTSARVLHAPDAGAAEVLLSHAADCSTNLLVMGAYGHSRMRELVLGGMTREIMRHMTVPVLMSH